MNQYLITNEGYSFWPKWLHKPSGVIIETIDEFVVDKEWNLIENNRVKEFLSEIQEKTNITHKELSEKFISENK